MSKFGKYTGNVEAIWCPDGRSMRLTKSFSYIDPKGKKWTAPKGAVVDGASIPRFAWTLVGGPFTGKYREASVIHDIACDLKEDKYKKVHRNFYYGMRASGVAHIDAAIKYTAVKIFGPKWSDNAISIKKICRLKVRRSKSKKNVDFSKIGYAIDKLDNNPTISLFNKSLDLSSLPTNNLLILDVESDVNALNNTINNNFSNTDIQKFEKLRERIVSENLSIEDIDAEIDNYTTDHIIRNN